MKTWSTEPRRLPIAFKHRNPANRKASPQKAWMTNIWAIFWSTTIQKSLKNCTAERLTNKPFWIGKITTIIHFLKFICSYRLPIATSLYFGAQTPKYIGKCAQDPTCRYNPDAWPDLCQYPDSRYKWDFLQDKSGFGVLSRKSAHH